MDILKLRVIDLKRELKIRGLKVSGNKNELVERLQSVMEIYARDLDVQTKQIAKKRILNHEEVEQPSIIFKMPIEIIEYIFDYLNLKDLSAVSGTCKRMQQLAGQVYQQSYSGVLPLFRTQGVWDAEIHRMRNNYEIDFKYFVPFVDKMYSLCTEGFDYLNSPSNFNQLSKLTIGGVIFNFNIIDGMKGVLNKLEYLLLSGCVMDETVFEHLLSFAPNLKRLCIMGDIFGQTWFERSYPTLEHCEIGSNRKTVPIKTFLERNPNIRKFSIDAKNLWKNRSELKLAEDVKLEDLTIAIKYYSEENKPSFWQLLNQLHQIGVYKRLNLYYDFKGFDQNIVDRIANVSAVNRVNMSGCIFLNYVALSGLVHLEDITFPDSKYITDIETVATGLKNLECIHFGTSNTSHVKIFMGRSSKLKIIRIDWFMDEAGNFVEEKVLNLIELNRERAKLPNGKKITLFVQEPVYLATKRTKRETDLDFIELKRTDSLDGRKFDFHYSNMYFIKWRY